MDLFEKIDKYLSLKEEISESLSTLKTDHGICSGNQKAILYKLMKDGHFEAHVFEIMLHVDREIAIDYIMKYYLDGTPEDKVKFKGNLDVMLDDYKEVLGKNEFDKLIAALPEATKAFYPIKEAIEFAKDE
jgi:hypothetical protein